LSVPREDASVVPEYFIDEGYELSLLSVRNDDLQRYDSKEVKELFTGTDRPLKIYRYN